ncbi:MAG: type II toxin-antitoxin system VapC family toxin [Verrucomicrobia bacterium]|nr:type II toxin-antitoxin system VapC family toxin [Verrucomicrobiota bacterium]
MSHYADSSFLVSCYVTDANTPQAKGYLLRVGVPLVFTALHALEVRNAFALGVFRGLFSSGDAAAARANLETDLRSGRLVKKAVNWPMVLRIAVRLAERHSATVGTRSLDVLHVATAKVLRAVEFVSFDTRQRTLAATVGLKVAP